MYVESAKIALWNGIVALGKGVPEDYSASPEENSEEVNKILRDQAYLRVIYEWVSCSDEIESTTPEEIFEEILDGWRFYGGN